MGKIILWFNPLTLELTASNLAFVGYPVKNLIISKFHMFNHAREIFQRNKLLFYPTFFFTL